MARGPWLRRKPGDPPTKRQMEEWKAIEDAPRVRAEREAEASAEREKAKGRLAAMEKSSAAGTFAQDYLGHPPTSAHKPIIGSEG